MGANLPYVDLGTGRSVVQFSSFGSHSCVILDNGSVKCWGQNDSGQLGLGDKDNRGDEPNEMGDNLPALDLGTGRSAIKLSLGGYFSCALLDNHTVKCWGSGQSGYIGSGATASIGDEPNEMGDNLQPLDFGTGRSVTDLYTGAYHGCALLDDGSLKCWGAGNFGTLGLGNTQNRGDNPDEMGDALPAVNLGTGRTALRVFPGHLTTCVELDTHDIVCFGRNEFGELGNGNTAAIGDAAEEMGDALAHLNLGTGRSAKQLEVSRNVACALLDNDTIKCWGLNNAGQAGVGNSQSRGDQPNEMGDALTAAQLGSGLKPVQLSLGTAHVCAVFSTGRVKCWGYNGQGQLGLGDSGPTSRGDMAGEMGDALPFVSLL